MSSLVSSSRKTGPPRSVSKQIFRVPHPGLPVRMRTNVALASEYGQLGEPEVSHNAVRELLAIRLDRGRGCARGVGKWWDAELVEHLIGGLRKAGLEIAPETGTARTLPQC